MKSKVIIIDSGLYIGHKKFNRINVTNKINFSNENVDDILDKVGHGTAVASVIQSINAEAEFVIIKIFDNDLVSSEDKLLQALSYLLTKNYKESIIHMSLGVNYYSKELFLCCKKLHNRGNLIVSAYDNSGAVSYPAIFDFVIGVEASDLCTKISDFILPENEITDVYSKGGLHRVAWKDGNYAIRQGNSISAAYVTGILSKYINGNLAKNRALEILYQESTYIEQKCNNLHTNTFMNSDKRDYLDIIKKVAIYPYNKETSTIIHFSNMLPFEIVGVFSDKYIGNIGQIVNDFITNKKYSIQNINTINYQKIDTLIIGHLISLDNLKKANSKKIILEKCLEYNVNVVSFDNYDIEEFYNKFRDKNLFIKTPDYLKVSDKKKMGKLFKMRTPVVGVFGTSSVQGKFTLQLLLRRKFLCDGYNVGQLSTEPTGILFGMDEVFPYGFCSSCNLPDYEFINELNTIMHNIDIMDHDIIIVGCQSRSIPEKYNNLGHMAIRSMQFLLGVLPDVIVLCVNINDSIKYIKRTIYMLENIITTKIIALMVYPLTFSSGWDRANGKTKTISIDEYNNFKEKVLKEIEVNIYLLNEENDINKLYNQITEYLS